MAEISLQSVLMIQGNETCVAFYSNKERNGYGFIVYLMKDGKIQTPIVSTIPYYPYKTQDEAQEEGDSLVRQVRAMNLGAEKSTILEILGEEGRKAVFDALKGANKPTSNP
ncbi:MAG TPA: hypothetical protein VMC07_03250 [Candidatus Omnitrophota bacterium]|nr:hypothetical protein [Candidatus Omnitrophota bacterium]